MLSTRELESCFTRVRMVFHTTLFTCPTSPPTIERFAVQVCVRRAASSAEAPGRKRPHHTYHKVHSCQVPSTFGHRCSWLHHTSLLPLNHVALRLVAVRGTVRASQTQLRLEHRARVDHTRPSNGRRPTPRSCLAARGWVPGRSARVAGWTRVQGSALSHRPSS